MSPDGAVDNEFDENERSYEEQVADALDGIVTEPTKGDVVIDLVTRQPLFVKGAAYETLAEHYAEEGYSLATYKQHAWLPVRPDDTVYECVFIPRSVEKLHKVGKVYSYPRGRLARCPVDMAWRDVEVGSL